MALGFGIGKTKSGGSGPGGNTIYTGDGTLAGNRTVDQNNLTLSFINTNVFSVEDDNTNKYFEINIQHDRRTIGFKTQDADGTSFAIAGNGIDGTSLKTIVGGFTDYDAFSLDGVNLLFKVGDINGANNNTLLTINDTAQTITLTAANGFIVNGNTGKNESFTVAGTTYTFTDGLITTIAP